MGHAPIAEEGSTASPPVTIFFTTPSSPITMLPRFATFTPGIGMTPTNCRATFPPGSESSWNGAPVSALNRFSVATSSVEMPTTRAPFSSMSAYRSRYAWVCFVQPGVKAFGKK
jgi:hypothetical protein